MTVTAVPPAVLAEAGAAAKAWLRAADGGDDETIAALCATAIGLAEAFCGQLFVARDCEDTLAPSAAWQALAGAPVGVIAGVAAIDAAGAATALPADAYAIDIDAAGTGWVRLTAPCGAARLTVRYVAGTATSWDALPAPIAQGIAMLVAHLFDQRDGNDAPPSAIAALWRPWRRMPFASGRRIGPAGGARP